MDVERWNINMTTILNNLKTIKQAPPDNHKSGSKRFEQTLKRIE